MKQTTVRLSLGLLMLFFWPGSALAWDDRGHGAIGMLAVEQLSPETRATLGELLGATDPDVIIGACTWPDTWRTLGDGRDQARWHFVRFEPSAKTYSRQRDCPAGDQCVPEQVNRHAALLGDERQTPEARRLAFKGLCHFLGELHQPMN
ncbi:MAG: S1/P1 nuclease, partial [Pseudomonadota bacterium]